MDDNTRKLITTFILIMCQLILVLNTENCFLIWMSVLLHIMIFSPSNNWSNSKTIHLTCKKTHSKVTFCQIKDKFAQMTVQPSIVSTKIKRTKFFFGYRYMWTRCQLSEPCSYVGAGVRKDVASPPDWTKKISDEMVKDNIV